MRLHTRNYIRYDMQNITGLDAKITIWDIWGVQEDNFHPNFLSSLLHGKIPDGFSMLDCNVLSANNEQKTL